MARAAEQVRDSVPQKRWAETVYFSSAQAAFSIIPFHQQFPSETCNRMHVSLQAGKYDSFLAPTFFVHIAMQFRSGTMLPQIHSVSPASCSPVMPWMFLGSTSIGMCIGISRIVIAKVPVIFHLLTRRLMAKRDAVANVGRV